MTLKQFKQLKIGDRVFLPDIRANNRKKFISTEVLKIDKLHKKISVLLGRRQFYSYKYIAKEIPIKRESGICVGLMNPSSWEWLLK